MLITPEQLREWGACWEDADITAAFDGRESVTLADVLVSDIDVEDIAWVAAQASGRGRAIACAIARLALPIWEGRYPDDTRPRVAIETAERPDATAEELRTAAWAAWGASKEIRDSPWESLDVYASELASPARAALAAAEAAATESGPSGAASGAAHEALDAGVSRETIIKTIQESI